MLCSLFENEPYQVIPCSRRVLIAFFALVVSVVVFHAQLALALLERGDAYMSMANIEAAEHLYERAAWLDPFSLIIAERRSFAAYLRGDVRDMQHALQDAHTFLLRSPQDTDVLLNDALCATKLHRDGEAAWAYGRAGTLLRDPQLLVLAGWAKARLHRFHDAHIFWRAALVLAPGYQPARFALQYHQRYRESSV